MLFYITFIDIITFSLVVVLWVLQAHPVSRPGRVLTHQDEFDEFTPIPQQEKTLFLSINVGPDLQGTTNKSRTNKPGYTQTITDNRETDHNVETKDFKESFCY